MKYINALICWCAVAGTLSSCKENEPLPDVVVDFAVDKTKIIASETVSFTDKSLGEPDTWEWTFEGGTPAKSTEQNPTITYLQPGEFKVTLKASNAEKTAQKTTEKLVFVEFSVGFTANDTVIYEGETITFTDSSKAYTAARNWTFAGGTPSTSSEQSPTVTYSLPGVHTVTLSVSDNTNSSTETKTEYIAVIPTSNLRGHYKLDGDASDASGNEFHGQILNGVSFTDGRKSSAGQAAWFNGVDGSIDLGSQVGNNIKTVSLWFNPEVTDFEDKMTMIFRGGSDTPFIFYFEKHLEGNGFVFAHSGGQIKQYPTNTWYQLVGVISASTGVSVYVDGKMTASGLLSWVIGPSAQSTFIGTTVTSHPVWGDIVTAKGKIDDVRFYDRELSAAEIKALYRE